MRKTVRLGVAIAAAVTVLAGGCGSSSEGGGGSTSANPPASSGGSGSSPSAGTGEAPAGESSTPAESSSSSGSGSGSAPAGSGSGSAPAGGPIQGQFDLSGASFSVGSKEFTESKVLAQITIQALQAAGATVTDKTGITGTDTVREALTSGALDMYWEYTGTGWVNILGHTTKDVPDDLFAEVSQQDAANGVSWLPMAPFSDTYAIASSTSWAQQNSLTNLSDVAAYLKDNAGDATLCAASEFVNRDDGLPGLEDAYGITFKVTQLDLNLVYPQVGKTCNFGEVFSTDARIVSNNLSVLDDDKGFFVPYNGALTVRTEVLDANPTIADLMAPISALLTNDVVTNMNKEVDVDGKSESDVAKEFLTSNGFIS